MMTMINQKSDRTLEIRHTKIFTSNLDAFNYGYRYIINTGGSRSSKTISILQLLIYLCLTKKLSVSVVRGSLRDLRKSSMRDFFNLLKEMNLYSENSHQKTENYYEFPNGSIVEFFGVIDGQKTRGSKRDILFCNEANELSIEEFIQLRMRTTTTIFIDRNPSELDTWVDELEKDPKSFLIRSTYKDNLFLPQAQMDEIESLINVDQNYYRIYALGLAPTENTKIYTHFKRYTDTPEMDDFCYGLDFGHSHHQALVKTMFKGNQIYVEELLYKSGMTTRDLINDMRELITDRKPIYCDSSRPDVIKELRDNGFNTHTSDKSVKAGIDSIRSKNINIHVDSDNLWKEYKTYSWKTNPNGQINYGEPIKLNDDGLDALRYSIHTHKKADLSKIKFY